MPGATKIPHTLSLEKPFSKATASFFQINTISVLLVAIEDYQEAKEFDGENEEIKEGLEKAQKLLKQSKKRDYYKILGIRRYGDYFWPTPLYTLK